MGRRTGTASVSSKPTNTGSARRLLPFISSIFYILLSILAMINLDSFKLALVRLVGRRNSDAPEHSTDSTSPTNPPNRNAVVQGGNAPPAVQAEIQNDNQAQVAPPVPIPLAMIPRRNAPLPLMGSLVGILEE